MQNCSCNRNTKYHRYFEFLSEDLHKTCLPSEKSFDFSHGRQVLCKSSFPTWSLAIQKIEIFICSLFIDYNDACAQIQQERNSTQEGINQPATKMIFSHDPSTILVVDIESRRKKPRTNFFNLLDDCVQIWFFKFLLRKR